ADSDRGGDEDRRQKGITCEATNRCRPLKHKGHRGLCPLCPLCRVCWSQRSRCTHKSPAPRRPATSQTPAPRPPPCPPRCVRLASIRTLIRPSRSTQCSATNRDGRFGSASTSGGGRS